MLKRRGKRDWRGMESAQRSSQNLIRLPLPKDNLVKGRKCEEFDKYLSMGCDGYRRRYKRHPSFGGIPEFVPDDSCPKLVVFKQESSQPLAHKRYVFINNPSQSQTTIFLFFRNNFPVNQIRFRFNLAPPKKLICSLSISTAQLLGILNNERK